MLKVCLEEIFFFSSSKQQFFFFFSKKTYLVKMDVGVNNTRHKHKIL